jgi:exopolysaccharide production protein ExoQ
MTAASPNTTDIDLDNLRRFLAFAFILVVFFIGDNYDFMYKMRAVSDERGVTANVETSGGGGSLRPLMFALLALFGGVCWMMRPAGVRAMVHGWLPTLTFIFILYVSFSVLWAEDQDIVLRRIVSFIFFCIAALGIAYRFSNRDLLVCCFVLCGAIGVMSLVAEIATGLFTPWETEYRLYGITHTNALGAMMAIFVLAALALRRGSERHRSWYLVAAVIGFGFCLLTKSRTAMVGLVAALWIWALLGARDRKRFIVMCLFGFALVVPLVVFLVGEQIGDGVRKAVLLGREGNSPETFTGRIPLWEFLMSHYLDERPFFGFGFQGFWTPEHILRTSASQGWLIQHAHSGYLNILLELGYVGLALFIAVLIFGCMRSYTYFRATRDPAWLFMTALLTWAIVASIFDSHLLSTSLRNFFCMLVLAKLALFDPRFVRVRESELVAAT